MENKNPFAAHKHTLCGEVKNSEKEAREMSLFNVEPKWTKVTKFTPLTVILIASLPMHSK